MGTLTTLTLCLVNNREETAHGQFYALNMQTLNRDAEYKHVIFEAPENENLSHMNKRVGISKIYYYSLCNTVVNNHS